jgi:hypothetical protein
MSTLSALQEKPLDETRVHWYFIGLKLQNLLLYCIPHNAIGLGGLPVSGGKSKSWTTLFYPKLI